MTEFAQEVAGTLAAGVAAEDVAAEFGVSVGTVGRWAAGRSQPPERSRAAVGARLAELVALQRAEPKDAGIVRQAVVEGRG
jgi:hypothetical protein